MQSHFSRELEQACDAINSADFFRAIEILTALTTNDAMNGEAWQQLGLCYLETRQLALAIEALTRSVAAQPSNPMSHYLLGNAYGSTGQLEQAAACYRRALEANPEHAKAEEFLIKTESLLESREYYRNALKLLYLPEPGASDLNRAIRDLVQSVAIFSESPAQDNLCECANKLFALRAEWPVSAPPDAKLDSWARACERGYQCINLANWRGALAAYNEALAYQSRRAFVHHALGFCFVETGELHEAVHAWLRTVELDPEYDFTRFGRVRQATGPS